MRLNFSEGGHPVFEDPVLLKEEIRRKLSFHFNVSDETVEVILRTLISVNQLSIHGAVADMCGELAWEVSRHVKGTGKPVEPENLETMVRPPEM